MTARRLVVVGVIAGAGLTLAMVPALRTKVSSAAGIALSGTASAAVPQRPETFIQSARRALAEGRAADAESLAKARPANDPEAAAILARLDAARGNYDDARKKLEAAAKLQPAGEAALELGLLLERQYGRSDAAVEQFRRILSAPPGQDVEAYFRAARASQAMRLRDDANALYRAAARSGDPAIETAWGELFYETHNLPEALKSFQTVLKQNERWVPAHLGVAKTLANENPPAAAAAAEKALEIDPASLEAQLFLADLDLDNTRYAEARTRIEGVLKVNPSHLEARAMLSAIAYVRGDAALHEAEVARVLAINPAYGEVYRVAGDLAARNYRFDEAVALTRKGLALDAGNIRAASDLGLHLMRTGEEAEARRVLERTFKAFPYDRVTLNLLELLDKLEKFEVVQDGDLIFKFHPDEAKVLREYAVPLATEAMKKLSAAYEFTPKGPILIEIFPVHDDFAVRNLGLPGLVGALGACFGRVVSMDSPRAKKPGDFSWEATLWHELAHVITLQMSNQRVPRWLTEGASVYEESRARPTWGGEMEVPFALAMERGQVLKLKDLNSGFTKPDTIALAYYQASLLVRHIVETHGEAKLRALLRTYGEGVEGDAAIAKALGVPIETLQGTFDAMLEQRFASIRAALRETGKPGQAGDDDDLAALKAAAQQRPGSYRAQLRLGATLAKAGDKAAFEPLEKAAALVPAAIGEDSPHAIMGRLAEQLGDTKRAMAEYQALLSRDGTAIEAARRLADLATKAGDQQLAAQAHERIVELDPFDASSHSVLGRAALRAKAAPLALREFRVALAIGPPDRATAHCDLAEGYLLAGRPADAKREALAALEIAPSFERAQDLLLKAIDGGQ
jgi:cellulose synthase operon protein C